MTKQVYCIYFTSFDIKLLFEKSKTKTKKPKTCSPIDTVVEVNFCCKAAFKLVQNSGVIAMFHQ